MLISGRADHVAYIDCCYCDIYKACYYYKCQSLCICKTNKFCLLITKYSN